MPVNFQDIQQVLQQQEITQIVNLMMQNTVHYVEKKHPFKFTIIYVKFKSLKIFFISI